MSEQKQEFRLESTEPPKPGTLPKGTMRVHECSLGDQIAELKRELGMRLKLYPQWIAQGRSNADAASAYIARMRAAIKTLSELADSEVGHLIGGTSAGHLARTRDEEGLPT